jgi:hypothetical protein
MKRTVLASCALVLVCHCGGKEGGSSSKPTTPPDAATSEGGLEPPGLGLSPEGGTDSGAACYGSGHGPPSSPPLDSRPSATTCPRTDIGAPDAGLLSCNTNADCLVDGANYGLQCVEHTCGIDQCLTDSDCPSNQLCVCSDMTGGATGLHVNECVSAACHTDADCGAGDYCIPSRGSCGAVSGYYCTSAQDTCVDPQTDCTACGGNSCVYTPVVGHFVCATSGCNG